MQHLDDIWYTTKVVQEAEASARGFHAQMYKVAGVATCEENWC